MKLAEKFKYVVEPSGDDPVIFTATRVSDSDVFAISYDDHIIGEGTCKDETEAGLRAGIIAGKFVVKEILIGNTQKPAVKTKPYRSGGRYLLQTFTFNIGHDGTLAFKADLSDGNYIVTWDDCNKPVTLTVDEVKDRIDSGQWVNIEKVKAVEPTPAPVTNYKPVVLGDEVVVRAATTGKEFRLKRGAGDEPFKIYELSGGWPINAYCYSAPEINGYFESGWWVLVENSLADVPVEPQVSTVRVKHVDSENVYVLKQDRDDGNWTIYNDGGNEPIWNVAYNVEEMLKWIDSGSWALLEGTLVAPEPQIVSYAPLGEVSVDGNLLISGSITEDTINVNDYFDGFPVEAEDLDLLPSVGTTLVDVQKFINDTDGRWRVEVDQDFFTVQSQDNKNLRFLARDEGELAAVFQAIRTLDEAQDLG